MTIDAWAATELIAYHQVLCLERRVRWCRVDTNRRQSKTRDGRIRPTEQRHMLPNERVQAIMTEAVLCIDQNAGASAVLEHFAGYPIHHLPVTSGPRVVGMLSTADVMKLEHMLPRTGAPAREFLDQRMKAGDLVRRSVVTVRASQSIEEAATLMAQRGIHALPVVNDQDHLVGIVTTTDIMSALLGSASTPQGSPPDESREEPQYQAEIVDHLRQRLKDLEEVLRLAERYVQAGQDEQLHSQLVRVIARINSQGPQMLV
jgi:CBS domain-containing protein